MGLDKLEHWTLKNLILQDKVTDMNHISSQKFILSFNEKDYYKSMCSETELFFNKSFIQLQDYNAVYLNNISGSWSLVTLYYFLFFNICCFMRFLGRGYVYLSKEHAKSLQDRALAWGANTVKIDSKNYFFKPTSINEYLNYRIEFQQVDTTHKVIWSEFKAVIELIASHAKDEELAIYDCILSCLNNNPKAYPSTLRNDLNYKSEESLQDLSKLIPKIKLPKIDDDFYRSFLKLTARSLLSREAQIESMAYISSYLYKLNFELSEEFYTRGSNGKEMKNKRNRYIV